MNCCNNDTIINSVTARRIFDSRGNPTVEATVSLRGGFVGRASVPSGASTGEHEACERRDGGKEYLGRDVMGAVESVKTEINTALCGMSAVGQSAVDRAMCKLDGTGNKSRLGANAILAVSLANARAAANAHGLPLYRWLGGQNAVTLPRPMMNILNGGAHAGNNLDIQEFMIVPQKTHTGEFSEKMRMCVEIYHALGKLLKSKKLSCGVGDEGGFAPNLDSDENALELICTAIEQAGYKVGTEVAIALDVAASEWKCEKGCDYRLPKAGIDATKEQLAALYEKLCTRYPIISIEDPFDQEDFEGFTQLREKLKDVQIVGDDLFVTNVERLKNGIAKKSGNAILIKPNQIGTLSETMEAVRLAKRAGFGTIISHRSGETADSIIADIAVGLNAGQIKAGAPCRSDRVEKYNRLLKIEEELRSH